MYKEIVINRANVCSSLTDPVQWSENLQLAINNGNQITLLDPKLPNIHQSIVSIDNKNTLDCKKVFNQSIILTTESMDHLNVGKFNRVNIESDNLGFDFQRINDIDIVKHQWSGKCLATKDCLLGVLLNTNELLILKKIKIGSGNYHVQYDIFNIMLDYLGIEDTPEINISYDNYLKLKIKDFQFTSIGDKLLLSVVNEFNQLIIFDLNSMSVLGSIQLKEDIISHSINWLDIGYISMIGSKNSVDLYGIKLTHDHEIQVVSHSQLVQPNRFKINHMDWVNNNLIISTIKAITIFPLSGKPISHELHKKSYISSLTPIACDDVIEIIIGYEIGYFESLTVDIANLTITPNNKADILNDFTNKNVLKFQLNNDSTNLNSVEKITRNYLNLTIDGNFINFGTKLNRNGIILIVYKIYAKNNLNYTILSKNEFSIGFLSVKDILNLEFKQELETSLSKCNQIWFNNYDKIQVFPKNTFANDSNQFITEFVYKLERFKENNFNCELKSIPFDLQESDNFKEFLIKNFTFNNSIKSLQNFYNFNLICLNSNQLLINKFQKLNHNEESVYHTINQMNSDILKSQETIEYLILEYLIKLIIKFDFPIKNELDKYLMINYYLFLNKSIEIPFKSSTVEFKTDYVNETFTVSTDDTFTPLILSNSNHQWSRCKMSLLPLLDLSNKVDELQQFNYFVCQDNSESLVSNLLQSLDYCIITGNKIYRT